VSIRSSILALTAFAVGTAALASSASAMPMGIIIKPKPVMGVVINPHPPQGLVLPPQHPIMGMPVNPHPIMGVVIHNPDHDHDHDHDWDGPHFGWGHHFRSPVVIESAAPHVVSTPVVTVPTSTPAPCTCLTKSYLQDGSVLFKDVCTKEAAVATPDQLRAQMQ
jgi:hypothetical protein